MNPSPSLNGRSADHQKHHAWLRKAALGQASDKELVAVARHLKWCQDCRHEFDQTVAVDQMVASILAPDLPSDDPFEPAEAQLLDIDPGAAFVRLMPLERSIARAHVLEATAGAPPKTRKVWLLGLAAALAAAALIVALMLPSQRAIQPPDGPTGQQFAMRGDESVAVRLFCADAKRGSFRPAVSAAPTKDGGVAQASCRLEEQLKVTYLNTSTRLRYLWVLAVDADSRIRWYYPLQNSPSGMKIRKSAELVALPNMITLSVNHRAERLRVFGVFSPEPITAATIEAAVNRAKAKEKSAIAAARLPLPQPTVQVISDFKLTK